MKYALVTKFSPSILLSFPMSLYDFCIGNIANIYISD